MNTLKLKGAMAEKGYTQSRLADAIGISRNRFSAKINGKGVFTLEEAEKIRCVLALEDPSAIFFDLAVPIMQRLPT